MLQNHTCFTLEYPLLVNVLVSDIYFSEASDINDESTSPAAQKFVGVWDTGATNTTINSRIINALNLQPSGQVLCSAVGHDGKPNTNFAVMVVLGWRSIPKKGFNN